MSLSSGALALELFTVWGPAVIVIGVALTRSALGPWFALVRLRRGRPARIALRLAVRQQDDEESGLRTWMFRVDGDAHLVGPGFHWVAPVSVLDVLDVGQPITLVHDSGDAEQLSVDSRWREAFALVVADEGPRWSATTWKSQRAAVPAWALPNAVAMTGLVALAALCLAFSTRHWSTFTATQPPTSCFVSFSDNGFHYEGWVTCWGSMPTPPADLIFNTLSWPFDGDSYNLWPLVTMVAVPALFAILFATRHLIGARRSRLVEVERLRVQEEQVLPRSPEDAVADDTARLAELDDPWDFDRWHLVEKVVVVLVGLGGPILAIIWIYDHVDVTWADWLTIPIVVFGDLVAAGLFVFIYGSLRAWWGGQLGRSPSVQDVTGAGDGPGPLGTGSLPTPIQRPRDGNARRTGLKALAVVVAAGSTLALVVRVQTSSQNPFVDTSSATADAGTSAGTTSPSERAVFWGDLQPGMCVRLPSGASIQDVPVVDCRAEHDDEVMALQDLNLTSWPGDKAIDDLALQTCEPVFQGYVGIGYSSSRLVIDPWPPDAESWKTGDHTVICLVNDPQGDTPLPLRGSNK